MNTVKLRKFSKFGTVYCLVVAIIWSFDYIYMPWLAIKFQYFATIPLYFSILLACWGGLYLYDFFDEDVFFIGKIRPWLERKSSWSLIERTKRMIRQSPKATFVAISAWWSPLHAYLFFRIEGDRSSGALSKIVEGSIYCAIFWSIVIDLVVFIWEYTKIFLGI